MFPPGCEEAGVAARRSYGSYGRTFTDRPGRLTVSCSYSGGSSLIGPHEGSVTRAKQELGVDERTEQRVTCGPIKTPQPLRLRRRQSKSGHLDVLALNSPENVVKRLLLCCHDGAPLVRFLN